MEIVINILTLEPNQKVENKMSKIKINCLLHKMIVKVPKGFLREKKH